MFYTKFASGALLLLLETGAAVLVGGPVLSRGLSPEYIRMQYLNAKGIQGGAYYSRAYFPQPYPLLFSWRLVLLVPAPACSALCTICGYLAGQSRTEVAGWLSIMKRIRQIRPAACCLFELEPRTRTKITQLHTSYLSKLVPSPRHQLL